MPSLNGFFPPLPPLCAQFYTWEFQVRPHPARPGRGASGSPPAHRNSRCWWGNMGGGWSHSDGSMPLSPLLAGEAQSWKSRATENPGWEGEGASGEARGKCLCVCLSITLEEIWCRDLHLREEMTTLLKQGWDMGVASSPQHLIWSRSLQWLWLLEEL